MNCDEAKANVERALKRLTRDECLRCGSPLGDDDRERTCETCLETE